MERRRRKGGVRLTMRKGETWHVGEHTVEVVNVTPSKVVLEIISPDGSRVVKELDKPSGIDRSSACGENGG